MSKGRPHITVRMAPEEIEHLREVARLYGSPDVSTFARELFAAILTSDVNHRMRWIHGFAMKLGEQLTLPLEARKARTARTARRTRDRTT